ncbi:hypothetical protein HBH56_223210 [Parastagonospora nodorum]|uniref:Uncharacterized protein n=1 Tax=Phaeosphaeria nodorum (strain SN15 / ATCC MYA-4574 / FGSC 10173) TaxID=321614 RepID=A0A7U2I866_PHANO|nr:hypothetical protein HBH56_223210 [Parastagonospora nodorum]QRD04387.1 hypothetical protein JI435_421070 [Parastagonospora nodorum SN15]KAH3921897.1 hypothetical protein HBH54_231360 [Parastagonospora nodorum]KAH3939449.1 hypothetical protein HBH53_235430 [Parastagonospora nodorum]KAH3957183.1 hypothetical protein HBH51_228800 [Parastagonospora nodorum]
MFEMCSSIVWSLWEIMAIHVQHKVGAVPRHDTAGNRALAHYRGTSVVQQLLPLPAHSRDPTRITYASIFSPSPSEERASATPVVARPALSSRTAAPWFQQGLWRSKKRRHHQESQTWTISKGRRL